MTGYIVLGFFLVCTTIIHFRGKRRFAFYRQIFDYSTVTAPINLSMYLFSKVPNTPFLSLDKIPELKKITDNWKIIRDEALSLNESNNIKASDQYNDIGFNTFFRRGWKRFYVKWYSDSFHPSALEKCPRTIELLNQTKCIKAAMFVVLPADSFLFPHRDPFAGSLRYHLGLETPNSDKCFIDVDGEKYSWKDGEAVLFDETYLHHAENNATVDRLIFFCDVKRPMKNKVGDWLNSFFSWFTVAAAKSPNEDGDGTGPLNKVFKYVYHIRVLVKKIKDFNRPIYYTLKYLLTALILYFILF